jgi:hypothetical protein
MLAAFSYVGIQRENCAVGEDVEKLKQRVPLLEYLRQQSWTARPIAFGPELTSRIFRVRGTRGRNYWTRSAE